MKALCLLTFAALSLPTPAIAQDLPPLPIQFDTSQIINRGRPGSASREQCNPNDSPLSAIAYLDPQTQAPASTLTSQTQPTLWFYVPIPIKENTEAIFTLKNSLGAPIEENKLSGQTDRSGIIGIPISTNLAIGDLYEWSLLLKCADNNQTILSGWIERKIVDSALKQTFEAVGDRNRIALYANYGFLQDAISGLANLRIANSTDPDLTQSWSTLLSDLNLSAIATEPLLACCQTANISTEEPETTEPETTEQQPETIERLEPEETETETPETETPEPEDNRTILQRARDRS